MIGKFLLSEFHCLVVMFICLGGIAVSSPVRETVLLKTQPQTRLSIAPVEQIAKSITVKIISQEFLGTGTLVGKKGKVYSLITNAHVLNAADPPYQVQTPDGRVYSAHVDQATKFNSNDLGVLKFTSDRVYRIASVDYSFALTVGSAVFASGFTNKSRKLVFTNGYVSILLDKPLEGGYQLGYTNDIRKGMSGGPVLNIQGKVVGINGLHKYPVWEAPNLYSDGSQPCQPLQKMIDNSSWAIPTESIARLAPKIIQLDASQSFNSHLESNKSYISHLVRQMQDEAVAAKNCNLLPSNKN